LEKNSDHFKRWELKLHINKEDLKFSLTSPATLLSHVSSDSSLSLTSFLLFHGPHFLSNDPFSHVTLVLPSSLVLPHSVCSLRGGFFSLAMAHSRSPSHALFYSLGFCSPHFVHHFLVSLLLIVLWFFPSMSHLGFITLCSVAAFFVVVCFLSMKGFVFIKLGVIICWAILCHNCLIGGLKMWIGIDVPSSQMVLWLRSKRRFCELFVSIVCLLPIGPNYMFSSYVCT